jgi:antirestriction protein ArdC
MLTVIIFNHARGINPEANQTSQTMNPTYQLVTDRIVSMLEAGTVPWRKPWKGGGGMPKNLSSRREYTGVNVWLLHSSRFGSPYWLTFKQALDLGGNVRKGEKGSPIVFTKDLPMKKIDVEQDDGQIVTMLDGSTGKRMLKHFTVFNLEQVEGVQDPEPVDLESHDLITEAQAIIDGFTGPAMEYGGGRACYIPSLDTVKLPEMGRFNSAEEFYGTAFHELAHSTGHTSRLNRGLSDGFGSEGYGKEELVAEMASAYLSGKSGISSATEENSAAYINGWLQSIKKDPKLVISSAAAAQRAANFILHNGATSAA